MTCPPPVRSLDARYYTDPADLRGGESRAAGPDMAICLPCLGSCKIPATTSPSSLRGESLFSIKVPGRRDPDLLQRLPAPGASTCVGRRVYPRHRLPLPRLDLRADGRPACGAELEIPCPGFDANRKICLTEVRTEVFPGLRFRQPRSGCRAPMEALVSEGTRAELAAFIPHWADLQPLEWVEIHGKLQLEGLGRELLRMLSLQRSITRPFRDRCHPARDL